MAGGDYPRVLPKEGPSWRLVGWLVLLATFGRNARWYDDFVVTVGDRCWVPPRILEMPERLAEIAEHEAIHVAQYKKFGLGNAWLGVLPYMLCYFLLPLPVGLAYCRYRLERAAYLASVRELVGQGYDARSEVERAVEILAGPSYGWCWPFPRSIRRWFEGQLGLEGV